MHVQGVGTARRQGDPSLKGVAPGKPVRDRAIELELVLLMTALNWAARERTSAGRRLLRENPLTGIRLPKEKNPERPGCAAAARDLALDSAEVGDGAEGLSCEGRRRSGRLEDRGSAGDVVPAGRRRNDQERCAAPDAPDRERVETHSRTHSTPPFKRVTSARRRFRKRLPTSFGTSGRAHWRPALTSLRAPACLRGS